MRIRWPIPALGLSGLVLHARELVGGRPYFRDVHQIHVPAKMFLAEQLRHGVLPQWWPWDGGGSALIPQPIFSVFHPTTLLYLLLPFWSAYVAASLCATWLALFGGYALGRSLGLTRPAALVAGALYGLCGYLTCLGEHPFSALAAGTMPWYLAALLEADRRRGTWLVLPAVALGVMLLAPDPQLTILTTAMGMALAVVRSERPARALVLSVVSPAVGLALAAIQLVPSFLVIPDTERGQTMKAELWALHGRHLLGLLAPENFGLSDWMRSTFFGWAGIGFVLASFAALRSRKLRPTLLVLLGVVLISFWLALGNGYGLNRVARAVVPGWSQLRYPMKSVVPGYLALALLAGFGFGRKIALWALPLGLAAVWFTTGFDLGTLALAATLLGAVGLCAIDRPGLAAGVVLAQAVAFALPLMVTVPLSFYAPSPIVRVLQRAGVGLQGPSFDRPFTPPGSSDIAWETHAAGGGLATAFGALFDLPTLTPALSGASWRVERLFDARHQEVTNGRLLGVFGVGAVVLQEPIPEALASQALLRHGELDDAVVALRKKLPRAYVTQRARVVATGAEAIEAVSSPEFAPGREIIVEDAEPHPDWSARPSSPAIPAEIDPRPSPNWVRVRATLPAPGFVVLNEAYFHGWTATVDGRPTPVLPANGLVRAVEVSAGEHVVQFEFHTPGLWAGAIISVVAWLCVLLAALAMRRSA